MTTSAIIMMVFGLGITWGGAALCIRKAAKSEAKNK
ncbi:MetS family NSS transporter small subunit [Psychromonas sp. PT13]